LLEILFVQRNEELYDPVAGGIMSLNEVDNCISDCHMADPNE
jgi:hypothetical protein